MDSERKYKVGDGVILKREDVNGLHGSIVSLYHLDFMPKRKNDHLCVVLVIDDPKMMGPYREFFWESDLEKVMDSMSEDYIDDKISLHDLGF